MLIYERDNYTCQYCGTQVNRHYPQGIPKGGFVPDDTATLDHIIPKSKLKGVCNNIITCCYRCNMILGTKGFKKINVNIDVLCVYKNKRKIIQDRIGIAINETPGFLLKEHKQYIKSRNK